MRWIGTLALASLVAASGIAAAAETVADGHEFFETKIRPVLVKQCYGCHSKEAKVRMGGLSLDTREGIRAGGQRGHAVVPFDAEASLLLDALRHDGALKMPPTGPLPDGIVQAFLEWIEMGAPDPRETEVAASVRAIDLEKGREYWAFQAPVRRAAPAVRNLAWSRGAIDQFVLASLEARGLRPVADAARADLLRRVTFDLTGLPPTPEEIEVFQSDKSASAYRAVIDRLLDSERFGERWGRHWLDVARYGDTIGRTRNLPFPVAWKYRDYVIRSFNADKPYDRFLREQLAGDLLPARSDAERAENQIATGFLAIGAHDLNERDAKQFAMDVADEMINVSTRAALALSVGCARCHDHKFDPIPTKDYYALAAIFRNSELRNGLRRRPAFNSGYFKAAQLTELAGVPDYPPDQDASELRAERARLEQELRDAEAARDRDECRRLARELGQLPIPGNLAMGVAEAAKPVAMRVNVGGDPHTLGERVQRGFVQALFPAEAELPSIGKNESGRLQLAQWLTRPDNPLTARVMANRVWHHLFGRGIVATVDNFGLMGQAPTHPELLDYLALRFMDHGWSVKSLIREIVLSRTYQLAADFEEANFEADPDNDYLWRARRRRLEIEALRDSILLVSGELQAGPPPPSPLNTFQPNQLLNGRNKQLQPWELEAFYRSVYVPVIRNLGNRWFETFDFPEPSETHGSRDVTTSPSQALFLMNSDFIQNQAAVAAERLLASAADDRERVQRAFRQTLSRDPESNEAEAALKRIRDTVATMQADRSRKAKTDRQAELAAMLAAVLDRQPEPAEIRKAGRYLANGAPGADRHSLWQTPGVLLDEDGGVRRDIARGLLGRMLGRAADTAERSAAAKRLRQWLKGQGKGAERGKGREPTMLAASGNPEHTAWSYLYHALYNSAEFRYRN